MTRRNFVSGAAAIVTVAGQRLTAYQTTSDRLKAMQSILARIRAPRITIVSCDPATLARDLRGLIAQNYRIEKITLADLFPQTFHLETVVELSA